MPSFCGVFTVSDKYMCITRQTSIMASRNHKALQTLSKTLYGTENYLSLQTKQIALIKAIVKDKTNKQNLRLAGQK
jgi:hypothetical protein